MSRCFGGVDVRRIVPKVDLDLTVPVSRGEGKCLYCDKLTPISVVDPDIVFSSDENNDRPDNLKFICRSCLEILNYIIYTLDEINTIIELQSEGQEIPVSLQKAHYNMLCISENLAS